MKIRELLFGYRFPRGREADTMLVVAALVVGTTLGGGLIANVMWVLFRVSPDSAILTAMCGIMGLTCVFFMMRRFHYLSALGTSVAVGLFYLGSCTFKPDLTNVGFLTFCYLVYLRFYSESIKPEKPKIDWKR